MRKTLLVLGSVATGCAADTFQAGGTDEGESEGEPGGAPGGGDCVLGATCEFDSECCADHECRAGSCQPPSTVPGCASDADCPAGTLCDAGACVPPAGACPDCPACGSDADCPAGDTCVGGTCVPPDICEDDDPSLAGTWMFDSTLYLGDGVDGFTAVVLEVADEFGGYFCPFVPAWACSLITLLGDINDMLEVMYVTQEVVLASTGAGTYAGTEEWISVGFYLDGVYVEGSPADVYSWEIDVEDFTATSCAGTLAMDEHHVSMNFCDIVRWAIDATIWAGSDGAYGSLDELVYDLCGTLDFPLDLLCEELVGDLLDDLIGCGGLDLLGFDYSGTATIASEEFLDDGVWYGEMDLGGDFPGDFSALKE